ncbi:MAG: hypothetical protein GF310_03420, partial [candidate division Zixibacteria bacterium]|nr:hypothetical protein [candidate division Zixibacteria bacterium]
MPERSEILSRDYILSTFKKALELSNADQTEIVLESEELSLTRFADSKITQNLTTADNKVIVRTIDGKRIGVSVSNSLDPEDLRRAVRASQEISSVQKPDEDFISLPQSPAALPSKAYHEATAGFSPVERAESIGKINDVGKKDNLLSSGAYRITTDRAAVVNSLGTEQFFEGTKAELSL